MPSPAFLPLRILPTPTHGRPCPPPPTCTQTPPPPDSSKSGSQWEQYAARDVASLTEAKASLQAVTTRSRHHHIFLSKSASRTFADAAARFFTAQREASPPPDARLWLVRQVADDTFGTLRGEPGPPRAVLLEQVAAPAPDTPSLRWIHALNRAGRALSPMQSHFVDWVSLGRAVRGHDEASLREGELLASEVLNADWQRPSAMVEMRDKLLAHADRVIGEGNCRLYEVLQSVDEPTCFKTLEVFVSYDGLREHMATIDKAFETDMLSCRAAVNRVRQLYSPLQSLHE